MEDSTVENITIDHEFIESILDKDTELVSYTISPGSKPGDNFMSVIYSIDLETRNKIISTKKENKESVETRNWLLKCFPSLPSRQRFNTKSNLFYRELEVYQTWLPELERFQREVLKLKIPVNLPFTYAVAGKATDFSRLTSSEISANKINPLDNFIMMEDLRKSRGLVMPNRKEPLDIHHMRLVIAALAKSHAVSWAYKTKVGGDLHSKFPFLRLHVHKDGMESWGDLAESNMDEEIKEIEKAFGAESGITKGTKAFKQFMKPLLQVFRGQDVEPLCTKIMRVKDSTKDDEILEPWKVIIHGDCWSSNMLFKYDSNTGLPLEVTFVDLQLVHEGSVLADLIHAVYSSTTTELRQNHLQELITLYFNVFNEVCLKSNTPSLPGFTLESLTSRFQSGKVLGFCFGLLMLPLMLKDETVDLETVEEAKDFGELLQTAAGGNNVMSPIVTKRVLQLAQEMHQDGII